MFIDTRCSHARAAQHASPTARPLRWESRTTSAMWTRPSVAMVRYVASPPGPPLDIPHTPFYPRSSTTVIPPWHHPLPPPPPALRCNLSPPATFPLLSIPNNLLSRTCTPKHLHERAQGRHGGDRPVYVALSGPTYGLLAGNYCRGVRRGRGGGTGPYFECDDGWRRRRSRRERRRSAVAQSVGGETQAVRDALSTDPLKHKQLSTNVRWYHRWYST